jgi:hypothetical protein
MSFRINEGFDRPTCLETTVFYHPCALYLAMARTQGWFDFRAEKAAKRETTYHLLATSHCHHEPQSISAGQECQSYKSPGAC